MVCRKIPDLPHTAIRAWLVPCPTLSCNSSGTALRQSLGHLVSCSHFVPNPSRSCNSSVTAIAILRASRAHQLARWFAGRILACHTQPSELGWSLIPRFPAIHLSRQSPFYGPPGHIRSRDGIDLCPSSDPNPSRHRYKAHPLARWFAGRIPACKRDVNSGYWVQLLF